MTTEELLAKLRDIHIPGESVAPPDPGFALWPFIVFIIAFGVIVSVSFWRRTAWRREARERLNAIEANANVEQRWFSLLQLTAQVARLSGRTDCVPTVAYQNPLAINDDDVVALHEYLRKMIG